MLTCIFCFAVENGKQIESFMEKDEFTTEDAHEDAGPFSHVLIRLLQYYLYFSTENCLMMGKFI